MADLKTTEPLIPAFQFGEPNQSVHIADDAACIRDSKGTILFSGNAEVSLDLLPCPGIHVRIVNQSEFGSSLDNSAVLELADRKCRIEGFASTVNRSTSHGMSVVWCPRSEPIIGMGADNTEIFRVVFHLFNFKEIIGSSRSIERRGAVSYGSEHVNLKTDNWAVELRSLPESPEHFKKLKNEGGYAVTHIGGFKRTDGIRFSGKEAAQMLCLLRLFFSFAKGTWCEPVCAVGFDTSGNRVWEHWVSPRGLFCSPLSWFDQHNCNQIEDLFAGFTRRWVDEAWRDAFHEVIYWYLHANDSSRGLDTGIILTQTALERLSFQYAVKDRLMIETAGFKDLRASDKLRLLLSSLDIPIGITTSTAEMARLARQRNWLDAPHAMTEVRNSLVHPEHKNRGYITLALHDAWNLGLWYLELALLRLCGYSGTYSNRLTPNKWVGQVEDVPWVKRD